MFGEREFGVRLSMFEVSNKLKQAQNAAKAKENEAKAAKGEEPGNEEDKKEPNTANDEASEAIIEVIQKFKKIKGEYIDI